MENLTVLGQNDKYEAVYFCYVIHSLSKKTMDEAGPYIKKKNKTSQYFLSFAEA